MLARTYHNQVCSVAWTLEVVGERWTLLIVRDALIGVTRFTDFRRRLGIAASVLAARLDRLVTSGVLERIAYADRPRRYEYRLTPMGDKLGLIVLSLMGWGDEHLAGADGPPRTAHHQRCGGEVEIRARCRSCSTDVPPEDVYTRDRKSVV